VVTVNVSNAATITGANAWRSMQFRVAVPLPHFPISKNRAVQSDTISLRPSVRRLLGPPKVNPRCYQPSLPQ
jgi:hypothetical protein